jgi:hypothetical protein
VCSKPSSMSGASFSCWTRYGTCHANLTMEELKKGSASTASVSEETLTECLAVLVWLPCFLVGELHMAQT